MILDWFLAFTNRSEVVMMTLLWRLLAVRLAVELLWILETSLIWLLESSFLLVSMYLFLGVFNVFCKFSL